MAHFNFFLCVCVSVTEADLLYSSLSFTNAGFKIFSLITLAGPLVLCRPFTQLIFVCVAYVVPSVLLFW